ncbi:MAG: MFS transporter [Chloroflexota bacterium]
MSVVAFSAIAQMMTMYGQTPGVAVFVNPVMADLGLGREQISLAYAFGTFMSAVLLPWLGRRMDLFGVRPTTLVLAVFYGLSLVLAAMSGGIVMLAVAFAGIRWLGQGALSLAARNAVTLHFRVGLARAVAISGSVAALGMSVSPFVLAAAITAIGWRQTWLVAAVSVWIIVIPVTLVLLRGDAARPAASRRPDATGTQPWTRAMALRAPMFWLISLANAVSAIILTGFGFHQIAVLGEAGLPAQTAAALFVPMTIASISFLAVVAPLAAGWTSRKLLIAAVLPLIVAMLLVPLLGSPFIPVAYSLAMGAALGAGQVVDGLLYPRHFGVHAIGAIRSAGFMLIATGSALGPVIVQGLRDVTGSYADAALILATLPVAIVIAAWLLPSARTGERPTTLAPRT